MLTFAEEILLLLLDDDTGKIEPNEAKVRDVLLAGAVLMDLALRDRIDTDLNSLFVTDATPTGEAFLDAALAEIEAAGEKNDARYWVVRLSDRGADIQDAALALLVKRGILKIVDDRVLWVFQTRRYPMIDEREEQEVRGRILDVLSSDKIPDPRDVALICLADAAAILPAIMDDDALERAGGRLAQLRKMDLIGQAMSGAVRQLIDDVAFALWQRPF